MRFVAYEGEEYGAFLPYSSCVNLDGVFVPSALGERICTFNGDSAKGGEAYAAHLSRARLRHRHTPLFSVAPDGGRDHCEKMRDTDKDGRAQCPVSGQTVAHRSETMYIFTRREMELR